MTTLTNSIEQLDRTDLLELYKISDENHRFYVDKRFAILSLYIPLATLATTGIYAAAVQSIVKALVALIGIALTLFLYMLEYRNWVLSNACLKHCKMIAALLVGDSNLHVALSNSHKQPPQHSSFLDKIFARLKLTQHGVVTVLSIVLLLYWLVLLFAAS